MLTKAIRIEQQGEPAVMQWQDVELPEPGPEEVLIRHTAIGLNYIDTYHRSGHYELPLPSGLGSEAAGIIESVGADVTEFKPGDRVAYAGGAPGAYAQHRVMSTEKVVALPAAITDQQAAAVLLKGMTVEYLLQRTHAVSVGEDILIWAAAGGVGLLAGQWAKALGARAIGIAGSQEKCELALQHGYAEVIDHSQEDVVARVKQLTNGAGVKVVYDSVGKASFDRSIDCLAARGLFVSFGNSSGDPPPVTGALLQQKGSLYFTRPTLVTYTAARAELEASAQAVFDRVADNSLNINIGQTYALADAVQAHQDLEAGNTTGSTLLIPDA